MTTEQIAAAAGDNFKYFDYSMAYPDFLKAHIPFGFPLFLKVIGWLDPTYTILPYVTCALWVTAVIFLAWTMLACDYHPILIAGILVPLIFTPLELPFLHMPGSPVRFCAQERPALALCVALTACLLLYHRFKETNYAVWTAVFTFLACLFRPALLFLPFLVILMEPRRKLIALVLAPFLLFCGLRWAVAGDFSFSSYGAIQGTRVYAMMVQKEDLPKLPIAYRPLAQMILDYQVDKGHNLLLDRKSERDYYARWYHGDEYHDVIDPFAKRVGDQTLSNAVVRGLWEEMIRLHRGQLVRMYYHSWVVALQKAPQPAVVFPLLGVAILVMIRRLNGSGGQSIHAKHFAWLLKWGFFWFVLSIGSLLTVQFPDDRYMQLCWMWVPSILVASIIMNWRTNE